MTETMPTPIPKLDGMTASRLIVGIGGTVELDRAEDHLRLLEGMRLGREVALRVTCRIASKGFAHSMRAKGKDELEDVTVYQLKLKALDVSAIEPSEHCPPE
jgi:hypothetical protein